MRFKLSSTKLPRIIKYLISVVLALILFFILLQIDKSFVVKNIRINTTDKEIPVFGLDEYRNRNLILLTTETVSRQLKVKNPLIKTVDVIKKYPDTLVIKISVYKPIAVIDNKGDWFYLSDDGRILYKSSKNTSSIPIINYYQKLNQYLYIVGDWITYKDIKYCLHFIKTVIDMGMVIDRVDINGADMILFKIDNREIIFTTLKSQELQNYELLQIIRRFKIEGRQFTSLDLRFEKPIVKF